jgi:hypothetical protein
VCILLAQVDVDGFGISGFDERVDGRVIVADALRILIHSAT